MKFGDKSAIWETYFAKFRHVYLPQQEGEQRTPSCAPVASCTATTKASANTPPPGLVHMVLQCFGVLTDRHPQQHPSEMCLLEQRPRFHRLWRRRRSAQGAQA